MLFLYDNAPDPRAKDFSSYPHHKHQSNGQIVPSKEIDLDEVLEDVESVIVRKR